MSEPAARTSEQEAIQGQIDAIRGDPAHPAHTPGHRLHEQEYEKFLGLYQQLHGAPAPAADALPQADDPPLAPRPTVFDDPSADPTAAVLDQIPPPELPPAAIKAGFQWDDGMLRAVNAVAEREGVAGLVLDVRHAVARALSDGPTDFATLERQLEQRWGRAYQAKLEAAFLALDELPPAVRANLEQYALDVHPGVLDKLARVGEALMDPTTSSGERRWKARYEASLKQAPR